MNGVDNAEPNYPLGYLILFVNSLAGNQYYLIDHDVTSLWALPNKQELLIAVMMLESI